MPVPALVLAQIAQAGIGIGKGVSQAIKARKLSKQFKDKPAYKIPESVLESTELARSLYQGGLPGQAAASERLSAATATGTRAAVEAGGSSAEILAAVSGLQAQETAGVTDLATAAGKQKLTMAQNLQGALRFKGQYEEKEQEVNVLEPYRKAKEAESAFRESSFENIFKGITGLGAAAETARGEGGEGKSTSSIISSVTGGATSPGAATPAAKTTTLAKQELGEGTILAIQEFQKYKRLGYSDFEAKRLATAAGGTVY